MLFYSENNMYPTIRLYQVRKLVGFQGERGFLEAPSSLFRSEFFPTSVPLVCASALWRFAYSACASRLIDTDLFGGLAAV